MTEDKKMKRTDSENPIVGLIDKQTTVWESGVWYTSQYAPWNPDDLYQKTGSYSIYDDMRTDDQVAVCMNIKKDLILGSGYHIKSFDEDHEEMREELEASLADDYEGCFEDALYEILSGYDYGFSCSERQFKTVKNNYLALKKIKTRHPETWLFHQDEYGNIIRYEQRGSTDDFIDVPKKSLIHFINNDEFGIAYGTSDLRAAYTAYYIKRQIERYYGIFLEKAAMPTAIAKYSQAAKNTDIDNLHNTIKKLQATTAMTIPEEFQLDFLETKLDGSVFINGIDLFNMFIGRALFIPDLLGFQGGKTTGGSQALGREQMIVFFKHIMKRRRSVENIVNEYVLKPLILWNYGHVENHPKFKLNPIEESVAIENAKTWLEAVKGRAFKPTDEEIIHFKKIVEFPEDIAEDEIDPIAEKANEPIPELPPDDSYAKKKPYTLPPGDYHRKVKFDAIESHMNTVENQIIDKMRPIGKEVMIKFKADIEKKKINDVKSLSKLENLSIPKSLQNKMLKVLNKELGMLYEDAQFRAAAELEPGKDKYAIQPSDEFLSTIDAENYNAIKKWEYTLTEDARVAAIEAIKDGKPISSVIEFIEDESAKKLEIAMDRYARTKTTEVLNKARVAHFDNSGVVAAYQYSAILDDRTTDICNGLDGKIFEAGTQPVPPMHFNCRSALVPITKYEKYTVDDKVKTKKGNQPINQFIEENRGKGFPKQ